MMIPRGPVGVRFEIDRSDLSNARWTQTPVPTLQALAPGQMLLAVDRFGLTANNITYALYGDDVGYWRFFPVDPGWGMIPVWGYANVVASRCDVFAPGERLFGFLPMASHLVIEPTRIGNEVLIDGSAHRTSLPPTYNEYRRAAADARHAPEFEETQIVLKPLLMIAWLVAEMLAEHDVFGADQIVVTGASSRTALGLATAIKRVCPSVLLIALTADVNACFVRHVGVFDAVFDYAQNDNMPLAATTIIDIAGNHDVLRRLHDRFASRVRHSSWVGDTHQSGSAADEIPDPQPVLFFAPDHILKRRQEWGGTEFQMRAATSWDQLSSSMRCWLKFEQRSGLNEIAAVYAQVLARKMASRTNVILSF